MTERRDPEAPHIEPPTDADDLLGPGMGGRPMAARTGELPDPTEQAREREAEALAEDLRRDERVLADDVGEASEQAGTGTDR